MLKLNVTSRLKALEDKLHMERLAELINDADKRLARLASKDMLEFHQKFIEIKELEARLSAIEAAIKKRQ